MRARDLSRAAALIALALATEPLGAQHPGGGTAPLASLHRADVTAGSAAERTLLLVHLASGDSSTTVIRPLARHQLDRVCSQLACGNEPTRWPRLAAPTLRVWYNSRRPRSAADGAVWQGRGVTAAVSGGFTYRWTWVDVALRPVAFASQNAHFVPLVAPTDSSFVPPYITGGIDLPFRFGNESYSRLDPGESSVRIGPSRAGFGVATSSLQWGPAHLYPLVLGTEAPGIPRLFAEIRDVDTWVGRGSAQWIVGRAESSPFVTLPAGNRTRLTTAVVATFTPRIFPGLELGGARFFHVRWDSTVSSWDVIGLPFKGLLKKRNPTGETQERNFNQLASAFVRLAPPESAVEVYGEFYREDHNADTRDLLGEPDHASAYMIGVRRVWRVPGAFSALTLETVNGRDTHLTRVRSEGEVYVHSGVREGHTHRGQLLGSTAALGGAGLRAVYARVDSTTSWSIDGEIRRTAHNMQGGAFDNRQTGVYALSGRRMQRRGSRTLGVAIGLESGFGWERGVNLTMGISLQGLR